MTAQPRSTQSKNMRVLLMALGVIAGMLVLVATAPAAYRKFCEITGISGTTSVTMEASQDGSSWAIMGLGDLDSSSGSQSVSIPTNLSEFTDVISNKSTASYRATSSGATQTVSCS